MRTRTLIILLAVFALSWGLLYADTQPKLIKPNQFRKKFGVVTQTPRYSTGIDYAEGYAGPRSRDGMPMRPPTIQTYVAPPKEK